jgi:hypothetical protein
VFENEDGGVYQVFFFKSTGMKVPIIDFVRERSEVGGGYWRK